MFMCSSIGAKIIETAAMTLLFVNSRDPAADDSNCGTKELPLKTIGRAVAMAAESNARQTGVRIAIAPGVYRESFNFESDGKDADAPVIIEAEQPGSVVIEGADAWDGWVQKGDAGVYTHAWPFQWGMWPIPRGWDDVQVHPICRRHELVFANGEQLKQVLSESDLEPASFYVSEEDGIILLRLPAGVNMEQAMIEVAVRPGITISGKRNLMIRGITIQHTRSQYALTINGSSNVLVEDCQLNWNNTGILIGRCEDLTLRRVTCNHNGGSGIGAWHLNNILFEDIETSHNNWRGRWAGDTHRHYSTTGWDIAGIKALLVHGGIFRRHTSVGNYSRGFWLDTDSQNVLIERARWIDNAFDGGFIEANQGPIALSDCVIAGNTQGILTANSARVTLERCILYGNKEVQLIVSGPVDADVTDFETKKVENVRVAHWHLADNVFVATDAGQNVLDVSGWNVQGDWSAFMSTLKSDRNLWFNPEKANAFRHKGQLYDFRGWQALSGQDGKSAFADPLFENPSEGDFTLPPDSPLKTRKSRKRSN